MGHRIEVELTSERSDGTWTWRAAGARQPKGVLDGNLLYEGARVGDVVRADTELDVDGITVSSVLAPRPSRTQPPRLAITGPSRPEPPGVTSSLLAKSGRGSRRPGREGDDGDRPERLDRPRRDLSGRSREDGPGRRRVAPTGRATDVGPADGGQASGAERPHATRSARAGAGGAGRPTPNGTEGPSGGLDHGRPGRRSPSPRDRRSPGDNARPSERHRASTAHDSQAAGGRRLHPANTHRDALVASLPPEQRPIAEQILRGGLPAVRHVVEAESARARAEGRPPVHAEPLLAMAEQLLPRLKAAGWRDRAEAAVAAIDEITLGDLRSVVASVDTGAGPRDEDVRQLATTLRDALARRVTALHQQWVEQIDTTLSEGHLLEALRLGSRPPDPGCRFPADLALRLSQAVGAAMDADTPPEQWVELLAAAADSPIRRSVKPAGLPSHPGRPLMEAARRAAGRVPALAGLLGLAMPPPPGPRRPPVSGRPKVSGRPQVTGPSGPPGRPRVSERPPEPPPPGRHTEGSSSGRRERSADPAGPDQSLSADGGQDAVLVEELGHALDQVEPGH